MEAEKKRFFKVLSAIEDVTVYTDQRIRDVVLMALHVFEDDPHKKIGICRHVQLARPRLYKYLSLRVIYQNAKLELE